MELNTILDILKVAVGLVYIYLEYYSKKSMWIVGIIMPAISLWLFWNKGLYADFGINIYYLLMAVYGYLKWSGLLSVKGKEKKEEPITHIPIKVVWGCLMVFAAVWLLIGYILHRFTDSTVVLLDSFTTALSIVGLWLLARRYVEQWLVWIVVDAVYVWLYYKKGIYFSGTLYMLYTIIAVFGYRRWVRQCKR